MPESELEVLVDALLSDVLDSRVASSASLLPKSCGTFKGGFCRGRGTGATMMGPGSSSVGVSGSAPSVDKIIGVVREAEAELGVSEDWSPSKLV